MKSPGKPVAPTTSRALAREVRAFCERNQLTPRESEILGLLVEGVVRIKDVALKLKLSPNTVNNHVNSIFMKTKTRSKSQVLAELLGSVAEELQTARAWRHSPRVLIVDKDPSIGTQFAKDLSTRGFRCLAIPALDRLEGAIAELGPDFVLVDANTLSGAPRELLDRVHAISPARTIFVGPGPRCGSLREAMDAGAIEWLTRPLDINNVATVLAIHSIEDEAERARWLEREAGEVKSLSQPLVCTPHNLGYGGVVISTTELANLLGTALTPGDFLELKLAIDKVAEPMTARGQVVWQGPEDRTGVRFTYLTAKARENLATFLRQHSVRSYIPAGS